MVVAVGIEPTKLSRLVYSQMESPTFSYFAQPLLGQGCRFRTDYYKDHNLASHPRRATLINI